MSFMDRENEVKTKIEEERRATESAAGWRFGCDWRVNACAPATPHRTPETLYELEQRQRASGLVLTARGWAELTRSGGMRHRPRYSVMD